MLFEKFLPLVLLGSAITLAQSSWPYGPFATSGRWIHNSLGQNVTYVGANWPGAADTMVPEGLQYNSIANIVSGLKSLGLNAIRLTYAIQLIDEIYENGADTPLLKTFQTALGTTNGTAVYTQVLRNNPTFTSKTTRLQVFDAIAAECNEQQIYVHLDNHVSKAEWCCDTGDGNGWFGDLYFNVANWQRGLAYMANHGKSWPNLMSMSLRNEPRDSTNATIHATYNYTTWYKNIIPAANAVNAANPNVLIFYSGLGFDTDLSFIPLGTNLGDGSRFLKSNYGYQNKMVLEIHNYQTTDTECSDIESTLYNGGYRSLNASDPAVVNVMPVVLTEWGHDQTDNEYSAVYQTCLQSYLGSLKAGWMIWVLAGSYYIRQGGQDYDETWGLYNHNWSAWRQAAGATAFKEMVTATLG